LSLSEEDTHQIVLFPITHWQYWAHRYLHVLNIYQNYNVWSTSKHSQGYY